MTSKDLFRAVGEVREDQIADAETTGTSHWRRYLAAAACFAVVLATALTLPGRLGNRESADQGTGDIDGSEYSTAETEPEDAPAQPAYSVGAEIGELDQSAAIKPPPGAETAVPVWSGWSRRRFSTGTR